VVLGDEPQVIHVGCCGWCTPRARYFREFDLIEVQQTFYEPPRLTTLTRWRQEAPARFHFATKCFQLVTHEATSPTYRRLRRALPQPAHVGSFRDTPAVRAAWEETVAAAEALGAKIVLLQTPASFTPTDEHLANLKAFTGWAPRGHDLTLVFEPRGPAWTAHAADRLCRRLHLLRGGDPFTMPPPPPGVQPLAYFRLHGLGGYRYSFREADLRWLAQRVREYDQAWVLFNNMSMWDDARRFKQLLARSA
jgi:uncharacterized protein YecE (DUF72 family)